MDRSAVNILVVDDEAHIRELVTAFLSDKGYAVTPCGDGYEAMRLVASARYDIVFLDVRLPELDGITTMHRLREMSPETKVVLVTASREDTVFEKGVDADYGADGFINKPFSLDNLLTCLDVVLRKKGKYFSTS